MKMWNSLEIECPETDLVEYPPQDNYFAENLQEFVTVLSTAANTLTLENPLWNEMKVLGNIQAKYKRILRCDRCLIYLQRIGHCLRKMVLLNLSKSYLDLAERYLAGFQDLSFSFRLPSRQQVEFILIRTLTSSKLVVEAIKYSYEAFCYLIRKLKVGHLILDLIMATSVTARMNVLLRGTLDHLCSIYKQVLFWRYKIKKGSFEWKEKIDLPQDIKEWLKLFEPGYLKPLPMSEVEIDNLKILLNQNGKKNEVESDTESVTITDDDYNKACTSIAAKRMHIDDIDYGEVIPRKKAKICHNLTNVKKSFLQKVVVVQSLEDLQNLWYDIRDLPQDNFPKVLSTKRKKIINKFFSSIKSQISKKKFKKTFKNKPPVLKSAISLFCKYLGYDQEEIQMLIKSTSLSDEIDISKECIDISDETDLSKECIDISDETVMCKNTGVSNEIEMCKNSTGVSNEIEVFNGVSNEIEVFNCVSNEIELCNDVSNEIELCNDVSNEIELRNDVSNEIEICNNVSDETKKMPKSLVPVKTSKKLKILYEQLRKKLKANKEIKKCQMLKKILKRRIDGIKLLKKNGQKANARKLILYTSKELLALNEP